ncbi:codeine O-demethylase-like [Olea europaea subsp. europaea]|uniref:Codeine O-demethylase-like n=2 Tax=Olea europaea subsp. europaea TaxID=158383 RepID=A0A8S0T6U0_OLEEU|nr:codeine O-demethylase-like [Olea europaea subsp. europaea]
MAESLPPPSPANIESLSNSVQELSEKRNNEVPQRYIHKGGSSGGIICASAPLLDVPSIDLSLLISPSPAGVEELKKLQSALNYCGCFQATNHGMSNIYLDKLRQVSKEFFALPMEEKQKYGRTADDIEGYGTDSVLSEHQILDWTDRLYLNISPEDKKRLEFWPENPQNFRGVLEEYVMKLKNLNEFLLKAMARSLNLEENCFLQQYGESESASIVARFNFYPACPRPDLALGVKPHGDASAITFLLQDKEVEGLQVLKDDQWFRVPVVPYSILVNVGDQVEIMSNGILKSPVHRVVTNSEKERNTLAVFFIPGSEMEIGPVEKLINEENPRMYKTVKDYVSIYFQHYQLGKRPIDALKI